MAQTVKNLPCSAGDLGSIPESGRYPGEGNGSPLQCSCLRNPMFWRAWLVAESDTTEQLTFTFMHWRKKWQPTPVFLPGESQGRGSLLGCRLWGHTEWTRLKRLNSLAAAYNCLLHLSVWVLYFTINMFQNKRRQKLRDYTHLLVPYDHNSGLCLKI